MTDAFKVSWYDLDGYIPDEFIAQEVICVPVMELPTSLCDLLSDEYDIDVGDYEFIIAERKQDVVLDPDTAENIKIHLEMTKKYLPESLVNTADLLLSFFDDLP